MPRFAAVAFGLLSVLPALVVLALPWSVDLSFAAAYDPALDRSAVPLLAFLLSGLVAQLAFVGLVVRHAERGAGWRAGWTVAPLLAGAVAAPAYWPLHVRPAPGRSATALHAHR